MDNNTDTMTMVESLSKQDIAIQFVAFFCMFISFIVFFIQMKKTAAGSRTYHAYTCGIVGFASVAYLFMALGEGYIIVKDGQIFQYARYLDWLVTTPLLLMDLAGMAGVGLDDQITLVILDVLMVLAGLAGGVAESDGATLALWFLGCIFFVPIVYDLVFVFPASAERVGPDAAATYGKIMWLTVVLWTLYPVVFFLSEYYTVLGLSGEILAYCILDVIAKCGFGFILLFSREGLEQAMAKREPLLA